MRLINILPKDDDSNIRVIDMDVPLDEIVPYPGRHNMYCGFCKRGNERQQSLSPKQQQAFGNYPCSH